ncbi:multidrug efflux RND transporter permease subunit [Zoogloea oleivorans]|uniref:Multidrug efflux RND transporter permease subunit n=2 Tax=Zoogloea oleivorans TaxID=1552750 RepID=A0A6C2CSG8_9RHOO|nr:multidrug efflux RND transporter permease subunit [Zoogloea oleivorans]TYC56504.1 multidrug efflux RND transporter permease subunit [Zoogloea oleivorans]
MNLSRLFIFRPVATTLLTLAVLLAGMIAFRLLPVSPLPQVDYPTISISANLPGASPETMAATVAGPLERILGQIAGVSEMTSYSTLGSTRVTLQFELSRDIDGAARDVQAAINAARGQLPTSLPSNPTYRKVNPAETPIIILALTSDTLSQGQLYDAASTVLAQRLSQVEGVGQVSIGGSSLPAVRVELDPNRLAANKLNMDDVRTAIVGTNANRPKGVVEDGERAWQVGANDQARTAEDYKPLIVAWKSGAAVRLSDVARVRDGVQDDRNYGYANGRAAVLLMVNRQPGANIIETVDRVTGLLPHLRASIATAIDLTVVMDRTPTIRGSLKEVERTLVISVALVVMVVFLFLRNWRATVIPSVVVPVSLVGTFSVMYLAGYSLDNLSLMALTIATGFVVDDAIVVLENISRHVDEGMPPRQAALRGAREIGFTVISMSLSLIAVFIPILAMGGIVGRLFREFAVTLSAAILVSMVVSLTATPMMCAKLLRPRPPESERGRIDLAIGRALERLLGGYRKSLGWALLHPWLVLAVLLATIGSNVYLYNTIPKGFFPQQDTGRLRGFVEADQAISFQAMKGKMDIFLAIVGADPSVANVVGFTGGSQRNYGSMFITLKPIGERKESADAIVGRLRKKLSHVAGANLYLSPVQDIRIGGRSSNSSNQFTLQSDSLDELRLWEPRIRNAMSRLDEITDVSTDQQDKGPQTTLVIDRDAVARYGLTMRSVTTALNNAYGQRQVSTIYNPLNQYRVVMEAAPGYLQGPESLSQLTLVTPAGGLVPLSALARFESTLAPLSVAHQGGTAASTISFALPEGRSIGEATKAIQDALAKIGVPVGVRTSFEGSAGAFQKSMSSQPILILAAILTIYIVLGMLYESLIHPITILSTLPSAGVGALLALLAVDTEFSLIAMIGVILLIGIVKKNAIMMIDVAIERMRHLGENARDAIHHACLLRFRPILMTTLAALFGAIPLAIGSGDGAELRQPLGIAIVGGLILSQILTLYTTPVVFVMLDRFRRESRTR